MTDVQPSGDSGHGPTDPVSAEPSEFGTPPADATPSSSAITGESPPIPTAPLESSSAEGSVVDASAVVSDEPPIPEVSRRVRNAFIDAMSGRRADGQKPKDTKPPKFGT